MIVVADTSPLNYLVLIGEIELLPALYQRVLIPEEVHLELQHEKTPAPVRAWVSNLPNWCEVRTQKFIPDASLSELDPGERGAIQLAMNIGVDTVLIDDNEGRRLALLHNLKVTGTISVLEKAGQRGLIDFHATLQRLEETNFRLSPKLRDEFIKRNP